MMVGNYRQDSKLTTELLEKDPYNKLYARGARVRLSAEQVRDQDLCVSGLLSEKMFGPSVFPYQPNGIWLSPWNGADWRKSEDENQYRRALYTYWKRTAPYPSMMTFDGSAREVCTARRIRTNTPLQALVTLNDSAYVEAAYHLALRLKKTSSDLRELIRGIYQAAVGHEPSPEEMKSLTTLYNRASSNPEMKQTAKTGNSRHHKEDDALMLVANTIFKL